MFLSDCLYILVTKLDITPVAWQEYHATPHTGIYHITISHNGIVGFATTTHDKSTFHVFATETVIDAVHHALIDCKLGVNEISMAGLITGGGGGLNVTEILLDAFVAVG